MQFPKQSSNFIEQDVSYSAWQQQVSYLRDIFHLQPQQTWLLFCQDSYQFSLYFFALIAANKRIVLPPNGQPLQLQQCMEHADIFLGESAESEEHTPLLSFSCFDKPVLKELLEKQVTNSVSTEPLALNPECEIIFFTSGSSGHAKAIKKNFEQLIIEVEQVEKTFAKQLDTKEGKSSLVMATVSHQHI